MVVNFPSHPSFLNLLNFEGALSSPVLRMETLRLMILILGTVPANMWVSTPSVSRMMRRSLSMSEKVKSELLMARMKRDQNLITMAPVLQSLS
jgi:hypothetical protein